MKKFEYLMIIKNVIENISAEEKEKLMIQMCNCDKIVENAIHLDRLFLILAENPQV